MEEQTDNLDNVLPVEDGTFVGQVLDSLEIPEMTDEEADALKEQEEIENNENVEEGL